MDNEKSKNLKKDKKFADKLLKEVNSVLRQFLSDSITSESERNSDTFVISMETCRVLIRVRRNEYADQYGEDFTIRYRRDGGGKTEFQRIMEGSIDYLFYGFAEEDKLTSWFIGDFKIFRAWMCNQMATKWEEFLWYHKQTVSDGTEFLTIRADEIPKFIVLFRNDK